MSQAQQNKNNAYRGREQAQALHEGGFNAELLGFYQDGEMKKVEKETYFVSSTSASAKLECASQMHIFLAILPWF
jgi:hypothetical protein